MVLTDPVNATVGCQVLTERLIHVGLLKGDPCTSLYRCVFPGSNPSRKDFVPAIKSIKT